MTQDIDKLVAELRDMASRASRLRAARYMRTADAIADLRRKLDEAREVLRLFTYPGATVAGQIGRPEISHVRAARRWLEDK